MPDTVHRFKRLVGGPSAGEWVADAAFEQPSPRGLVTTTTPDGRPVRGMIPANTIIEVTEYHARTVALKDDGPGPVVEAFIHDQIAYDVQGRRALLEALVAQACGGHVVR